MLDIPHGALVVARLLASLPVDPVELAALRPPWLELARAMLGVHGPQARTARLKEAVAGHPDRARILEGWRLATRLGIARTAEAIGLENPAILVSLAEVEPESVRWLWPGRVPLGKLTILDGDPGLGKSAITLDLAARLSAGRPMPDHHPIRPERVEEPASVEGPGSPILGDEAPPSIGEQVRFAGPGDPTPRGVVLLSAEDGLADTIRPRLEAAGADLDRVAALTLVQHAPPSARVRSARRTSARNGSPDQPPPARLPTLADLEAIRDAVVRRRAALVVVDPVMAYLPDYVDPSKDAAVRAVLTRLAAIAQAEGVAILAVRHLTKARAHNPLYRGGGSIGIIGAARAGLLVAPDPLDPTGVRRVLAATKANLVDAPPALAYRLETAPNGAVRVVWEGPSDHTAASLLDNGAESSQSSPSALVEAREFIQQTLADGPQPAALLLSESHKAGINLRTLRRASRSLGIHPRRTGSRGAWVWSLPPIRSTQSPSSQPDPAAAEPTQPPPATSPPHPA